MLRLLRIIGILFFSVLIGVAANRLQEMYEAGTLLERYNSQRRADITLLIVSTLGLVSLSFFEFFRMRRRVERRGYGTVKKEQEFIDERLNPTSIYSAPKAVDEWQGRRARVSKSRHSQRVEPAVFWMGLLRIYCVVLPAVYLYTLGVYLFSWLPSGAGNLTLSIFFPVLLLISLMTSVGLLRKKPWGMNCGYAVAIFHLLIFPLGTAAGLVLLVGLIGATSEFVIPSRKRRRRALRKTKRKLRSATA